MLCRTGNNDTYSCLVMIEQELMQSVSNIFPINASSNSTTFFHHFLFTVAVDLRGGIVVSSSAWRIRHRIC